MAVFLSILVYSAVFYDDSVRFPALLSDSGC